MKCFIVFFLFLSSAQFVSAQNAKKLNIELRSQLNAARAELDSINRVISFRKTGLHDSWLKLKKNEFDLITAWGQQERLLKSNISFLYKVLTNLGDNPQQRVDITKIEETEIPLLEFDILYRSYSYMFPPKLNLTPTWVRDTLLLDKYKVKEENEQIHQMLKQYADAKDLNLQSIATLTQYGKDMSECQIKFEVIYKQSIMAYDALWNANSILMDRYSKLNKEYLAKGPKAFPPVYKKEFEMAEMAEYPKLIVRVGN